MKCSGFKNGSGGDGDGRGGDESNFDSNFDGDGSGGDDSGGDGRASVISPWRIVPA